MSVFHTVLIAVAACVVASIGEKPVPADSPVIIHGEISNGLMRRLADVDWSRASRVELASAEGDPDAAVQLTTALRAAGKPITVVGPCGTYCLLTVASASTSVPVTFSKDAVILLDETATSAFAMFGRAYPNISSTEYLNRIKSEQTLIGSSGLDERILVLAQSIMDTRCFRGPARDDPALANEIQFGAVYTAWAPTDGDIARLGFVIVRTTTPGETPVKLTALPGYGPLAQKIVASGSGSVERAGSYDSIISRLSKTPRCGP